MEQASGLILLVDDNAQNLQVVAGILNDCGYEFIIAMRGSDAIQAAKNDKPDLILLDVMMPEMDGFQVCDVLKHDLELNEIPIIFLTAKSDIEDIVKGLETGGVDYISKPFNQIELKLRIKTHLELKKSKDALKRVNADLYKSNIELERKNEEIINKNHELEQALKKMEHMSITDPLTQLYNRRYLITKMEEEITRVKRTAEKFSLIMTDIDFFKNVNDLHGHDSGDSVLVQITKILQDSLREQDFLARWGGEEFLFLLPGTTCMGAASLAERIRETIFNTEFQLDVSSIKLTMTFGVVEYVEKEKINETIKRADDALYKGKSSGRNCVISG